MQEGLVQSIEGLKARPRRITDLEGSCAKAAVDQSLIEFQSDDSYHPSLGLTSPHQHVSQVGGKEMLS